MSWFKKTVNRATKSISRPFENVSKAVQMGGGKLYNKIREGNFNRNILRTGTNLVKDDMKLKLQPLSKVITGKNPEYDTKMYKAFGKAQDRYMMPVVSGMVSSVPIVGDLAGKAVTGELSRNIQQGKNFDGEDDIYNTPEMQDDDVFNTALDLAEAGENISPTDAGYEHFDKYYQDEDEDEDENY